LKSVLKIILWFIIILIIIVGAVLLFGGNKSTLSSSPSACVNNNLSQSSSGHCVSDLQTLLNWGLYGIDGPNYQKVTGQFSASTTAEVKQFQTLNNIDASGTLNKQTWIKLCDGEQGPPASWTAAAKDAGCKV
jgi:hypothetical protein